VRLGHHLLPGRGASAISPRSGKQHLFRDSLDTHRRHAFGLPVVGDLT
jgi:hypothetical protein